MSYCVNCGVALGDSERRCPLCGTEVINPNCPPNPHAKTLFPPTPAKKAVPQISRHSVFTLVTLLFLIPLCLSITCDININNAVTWSGFVIGALVILYVIVLLPLMLAGRHRRWAPLLCLALDFSFTLGFIWYVAFATGGGWFLPFAMPVITSAAVLVLALTALGTYAHISGLMLTALSTLALGIFCIVIELFLNLAFSLRSSLIWSLYPAITMLIGSIIFAVIDRNPALKARLARKFFI